MSVHVQTSRRVSGTAARPRASVTRSSRRMGVQLIDDTAGRTVVSAWGKPKRGVNKTKEAEAVGKVIAEKAIAAGIKKIVFDRRRYKYHGRVKALADAMRNKGLVF